VDPSGSQDEELKEHSPRALSLDKTKDRLVVAPETDGKARLCSRLPDLYRESDSDPARLMKAGVDVHPYHDRLRSAGRMVSEDMLRLRPVQGGVAGGSVRIPLP
jgi:hypothetical protein